MRRLFLWEGKYKLIAELIFGSRLRLLDCLRLRVKDIDFALDEIVVRDGKGHKDRVTVLPKSPIPVIKEHLVHVKRLHEQDLSDGYGNVYLPYALARKYPNANREWMWQYVFPSRNLSKDLAPVK
ncbi:MAG: tyrosine-type recombinase/integrase [bacterium]